VEITINGKTELKIKYNDRNKERFEVPYNHLFPHDKVFDFPIDNDFDIKITEPNFGLLISRKSTGE
jgi:hypothetical protein